jgi:ureidoglycolate lyase
MKVIQAVPLTKEAFAPFGEYYDMVSPTGYALQGELHSFYPDRISEFYSGRVAFSPMTVKKPSKMTVTQLEYHTTTPEMLFPMNDDMVIHVAPASGGKPVTALTQAFIVPKFTLVKIRTAIWHLAPLPLHEPVLNVVVILPECTYANDCTVVPLGEEEQFEIVCPPDQKNI